MSVASHTLPLPAWLQALPDLSRAGRAVVMVTVAGARGSTPRPSGTRMLITTDTIVGTIGGGQLEHTAVATAREWLCSDSAGGAQLRRFALGPALQQCCGGVADLFFELRRGNGWSWAEAAVAALRAGQGAAIATVLPPWADQDDHGRCSVMMNGVTTVCLRLDGQTADPADAASPLAQWLGRWLVTTNNHSDVAVEQAQWDARAERILVERLRPPDWHISLFGAGHVGRAIAAILATLPCAMRWIDSRADEFPNQPAGALASNTERVVAITPSREVFEAPPGSYFLIMTHSHPLDEEICDAVLSRDDIAFCGLIGSASKARQFTQRLARRGHSASQLARLTCPIGMPGVGGKAPAEIAVAVVADLLRRHTLNRLLTHQEST